MCGELENRITHGPSLQEKAQQSSTRDRTDELKHLFLVVA
jgi:hypothetical protein